MSSAFDRDKLVDIFVTEALDGLRALRAALYPSEDTLPQPESLQDVYIVAHRMKGSALQYGFESLAEAAGALESVSEKLGSQPTDEWPTVVGHMREMLSRMELDLEEITSTGGEQSSAAQPDATDSQTGESDPESTQEDGPADAQANVLSDDYLFPDVEEEMLSFFEPEAQEYLDAIESNLLRLEKDSRSPETIQELFRSAHTLKGSAYTIGFQVIGDVAHPVEDLLGAIREGQRTPSPASMDLIFRAVDVIRLLLKRDRSTLAETREKVASLLASLRQGDPLGVAEAVQAQSVAPDSHAVSSSTRSPESADAATADVPAEDLPDRYFLPEMNVAVLTYFAPEAQETLNALEGALFLLERDVEDEQALDALLQNTQLLKNSAYEVHYQSMGDLLSAYEELLLAVKDGNRTLDPRLIDVGFKVIDVERLLLKRDPQLVTQGRFVFATVMEELRAEVRSFATGVALASSPAEAIENQPSRQLTPRPSQAPGSPQIDESAFVRVSQHRLERLLNLVGELVIGRGRLDQRLKLLEQLSGQVLSYRNRLLETVRSFETKHAFNLPASTNPAREGAPTGQFPLTDFGALELDKYDDFNILARRVGEVAGDVSESMTQLNDSIRQAREDMGHVQHLTTDMRQEIARTRMVPIGRTFLRFQRAVREMARATGKEVTFVSTGEQTEVDTTLVERLVDPLIHLIRNAVYHGIEPPAARIAADKHPVGTISVRASHRGSQVIIEVEDDGAGLNLDKIKTQAVATGHLRPDIASNLSPTDVTNLIFLPGFSTAESVGDQAGRGVGMDVVKTTIEGLNGRIQVESEHGQRTTFTLELPLTLLITTALLVRVNMQRYAIPLPSVREVVLPAPGEIQTLSGRTVIQFEEETINVESLANLLNLNVAPAPADVRIPIVITRTPTGLLGLIVDELLGRQEIVIKGLGTLKPIQQSCFGGATIDPQGQVVLVLDVVRLGGRADERRLLPDALQPEILPAPDSTGEQGGAADGGDAGVPTILLIDDSLSIRKFVGRMLESGGYIVDTAVDGEDGLRKSSATSYSLIITDLEMPKVNGYEVIQALRGRAQTRSTPVVVMTTRAADKHRQLAMSLGASAYIAKPVEERALLREISRWIGWPTEVRR